MIIVAYVVCSTPHICSNLSFVLIKSNESMERVVTALPWILILRISNSAVNPVIYYTMMPAMRLAMRNVVHCNTSSL